MATTDTPSRATADKALHLPVAETAGGRYIVASGSEPGKTYAVTRDEGVWECACVAGAGCSHVWAAMAHADPAVRRALLKRARPARRMTARAADELVQRYDSALAEWIELGPERARARTVKARAAIIARLTGNDDGDE